MLELKISINPGLRFFLAAGMAAVVVACSHDEPMSLDTVSFDAWVSGSTMSRGSVRDEAALKKDNGFGVLAFNTGSEDFNPEAEGGHTPDFMYNVQVKWQPTSGTSGIWAYSPNQQWTGGNVSFFAYAPYSASASLSPATSAGSPTLAFTVDENARNQTDLLYADTQNTLNRFNGEVALNFKHALSRISVKIPKVKAEGATITVNSVSFQSTELPVSGVLNLYSGRWSNLEPADRTYTLSAKSDMVEVDAYGTLQNGSESYLMIIPAANAVEVNISVNYTIRINDDKLTDGYVEFTNTPTVKQNIAFESGKAYDFTLKVTPASVLIEANIVDWDETTEGDWESNGSVHYPQTNQNENGNESI